jgi:hypothetical protein
MNKGTAFLKIKEPTGTYRDKEKTRTSPNTC